MISLQNKSDQSVTQCRQVLGHKGSNALMTEPLVAPNGGALVAPNGREEEVQGSTPCCAELVSFVFL